ncbi:MAG: serine hydrolase [Gemmatimonadetes bacterium]|nr:serine hydrolase [Gemmatimonadota bacterium]
MHRTLFTRNGFTRECVSALFLLFVAFGACASPRPFGGVSGGSAIVGPANGSLVIVGGGAMGPELYKKFIELAGGPDAPIVVVPTAGGDSVYPADWVGIRALQAAGARHVTVLHTLSRKEADSEAFVAPLRSAGGVWFPGGRQWHLVDSYLGTRTEREFHAVLARGGVVGGSSAGASIIASYLVRGAREGNTVMMAPGYEQGFGFLRNAAIDQHVVARDRLEDLPEVIAKHKELIGISEDEGTAWVVRGDQAEIIGRNKAFVYGGSDANDPGKPYLTLRAGDRYDLAKRTVTHRASADSPLTAAFIDSLFADYAKPGTPGAAVLVAQDGNMLVNRGYGLADVNANAAVTTRTNFRLASVTKQFTAAATLLLVKDGKLTLDETLADIWPDFPAYGRRVTVKQLLTHTGGLLSYEDFVPDSQTRQTKDAEVVDMMKHVDSTYFAPGSQFRYSNTGYAVLAEIVAKRSGIPFATFLRDRIFVPLGMHKTIAREDRGGPVLMRAYGHSMVDGKWQQTDQSNTSAVLGDGGIYSSVDELFRWSEALYSDELLPAALRTQAFTNTVLTDGKKSGYGFGWFVDPYRALPRLFHTGSSRGFRTVIVRFPTMHATIIILTNRNEPSPEGIANAIADRLLFTQGDARWEKQKFASTSSCRSLSAVSETVAWAGCTGGKVFHTSDGGATWMVDSVPGAARLDFRGIKAFDANTAVVSSAGPAEQGQARIYRTTDGAKSWQLAWSDSTKGIFLDGLAFWDALHGFTFSDPIDGKLVIFTTDDGGKSWQRVNAANIPPVIAGEAAFAASNTQLTTQGEKNAWIASGGGVEARVYRTTDRGRTWHVSGTGMPGGASAGLFGIAFSDARNGLAVGGDFNIARGLTDFSIRTFDGGVTWHPAGRPDGATQGLHLVPGSSPPMFVGAGAWGTAISRDFGTTWQHGDTLTAWGIGFVSPTTGWVVGPRGHLSRFRGSSK